MGMPWVWVCHFQVANWVGLKMEIASTVLPMLSQTLYWYRYQYGKAILLSTTPWGNCIRAHILRMMVKSEGGGVAA